MGIAETLDNVLFTSATGLFKAYGIAIQEAKGGAVPSTPLCAVIGFTGPWLCGAAMIAADNALIAAACPVPGTSDRDWLAELANQLLGRVKNRLLPYGVEVYASTPVVLRGDRIAPLGRDGTLPGVMFQTTTGYRVTVWIDHTVLDASKLDRLSRGEATDIPREGDVILF